MGKIEGIFATNISGKVGNVVFRKNGKQNIVSQRPASVKNPRTDMQQRQRAYIKTVTSAYSVLRPICGHSFEGVAYGANSMNFFKKENYNIVSNAGRAVIKNSSNVVVDAPFLISKGSIIWNRSFSGGGQFAYIGSYMHKNNINSVDELTFAQLLDALNLKKGDQITVINVWRTKQSYVATDGVVQYACEISYSRYILESEDDYTKAFIKRSGGYGDYILNTSILAENTEINTNSVIVATPFGNLNIYDVNNEETVIYSAIISRRYGDQWLRSSETLYVHGYVEEDNEFLIDKVLPSYSPSGERYLNNAEK